MSGSTDLIVGIIAIELSDEVSDGEINDKKQFLAYFFVPGEQLPSSSKL